MTQNQIRYLQYLEDQRSNLAKEAETNRSNLENERLNREKLEYDKYGNSKLGSAIRTIKGIGDDINLTDITSGLGDTVKSVVTGETTNALGETIATDLNPSKDPSMVTHTEGNEVSGWDWKSDVGGGKYANKSYKEIAKIARESENKDLNYAERQELLQACYDVGMSPNDIVRHYTYLLSKEGKK